MAIGEFIHKVTVQASHTVPDGDGGTIEVWDDLPPKWDVSVTPAPVRDLERLTSQVIMATATHIIHGWDRRDVTTKGRLVFVDQGVQRRLVITGLARPQERRIHLYVFAKEAL